MTVPDGEANGAMVDGVAGGVDGGVDDEVLATLPAGLVMALAGLALRSPVLVAVDFDGTMAPIVAVPADARPLPAAVAALGRLAGRPGVRVAVLSGRSLTDLRRLASPPPAALLIGGHGAEPDHRALIGGHGADPDHPALDGADPAHLLRGILVALQGIRDDHPGTLVEAKAHSAALHTRQASRLVAAAAARAALEGPARWPGVRVLRGKEVVELSVSQATKGTALSGLRSHLGIPPAGVLYLGDDATDELAFAVLDQARGDVAVKVGEGDTVAGHRVSGPQGVAAVLDRLDALIRSHSTSETEAVSDVE